jgi:hypothetical protein
MIQLPTAGTSHGSSGSFVTGMSPHFHHKKNQILPPGAFCPAWEQFFKNWLAGKR